MTNNPSLQDLMTVLNNPMAMNQINLFLATTYEQWVSVLYEQLDSAIERMEDGASYYQKNSNDEDTLTHHLINPLSQLGYNATHDTYTRGHVDIKIIHRSFVWLGEAKIYNSYTKLLDGYQQLTTRYSSGDVNKNQGGMLIYYYGRNTKRMMNAWQRKLGGHDSRINFTDCSRRPELAFISNKIHEVSGLEYRIRHIPVMLRYSPKK
ncbi:hypothetical protein ACIKP9_12325 [Methylobacillus methanolivorans]|uniref:Restriction endonuclease n=1 Tax=Methylobacillus methanolivorans TaxID=1848927 RepID=A0ABW8GP25_9PROT